MARCSPRCAQPRWSGVSACYYCLKLRSGLIGGPGPSSIESLTAAEKVLVGEYGHNGAGPPDWDLVVFREERWGSLPDSFTQFMFLEEARALQEARLPPYREGRSGRVGKR